MRYVADAYSSPLNLAYGSGFVDESAYVYLVALLLTDHEEVGDGRCVGRVCRDHLVGLFGYALVDALSLVEAVEYDEVLALVEQGLVVPAGSSSVDVGQEDVVGTLVAVEAVESFLN